MSTLIDCPGPLVGPSFIALACTIWAGVLVYTRIARKRSRRTSEAPSRAARDRLVSELIRVRSYSFLERSPDLCLMVIEALLAFGCTFTVFHWVGIYLGSPMLAIGAAFLGCTLGCLFPEYVAHQSRLARAQSNLDEFDRLHPHIRQSDVLVAEIGPLQSPPRYREPLMLQRPRAMSISSYARSNRGAATRSRQPVESL